MLLTNVKIFTQNEAFLVENVKQEFLINHIQLLINANKPITMQKIHTFRHKDGRRVTSAEDHIGYYSSQIRTGNWGCEDSAKYCCWPHSPFYDYIHLLHLLLPTGQCTMWQNSDHLKLVFWTWVQCTQMTSTVKQFNPTSEMHCRQISSNCVMPLCQYGPKSVRMLNKCHEELCVLKTKGSWTQY